MSKEKAVQQKITDQRAWLNWMEIRVLDDASEIEEVLDVLSRGIRDNPLHVTECARCWMGVWEKHDSEERHWHLGPLAVDAHLQGIGVGSRLMQVFCAQMDAAREDAFLEIDKLENVHFYERFGFKLVCEQEVLGVSNYFMLRRPDWRHE